MIKQTDEQKLVMLNNLINSGYGRTGKPIPQKRMRELQRQRDLLLSKLDH